MSNLVGRLYSISSDEGLKEAISRSIEFSLRKIYLKFSNRPQQMYFESISAIAESQNINICYNSHTQNQYDESKINVLIATESPAVVEEQNWLDPAMDFHAEFSFGNFYQLDDFYSLRRLHTGRDNWVELRPNVNYNKRSLVSTVLSTKSKLEGHRMRHRVATVYDDVIDCFGAGVDNYIEKKSDSLDEYMFQIVIENGKYPEYVSEKFFDCLKTNTIPIYWGGHEAVKKLGFNLDGVIFFENMSELDEIVTSISQDEYQERRPASEENLERLMEIRNNIKKDFYLSKINYNSLGKEGLQFN